MSWLNHQPGLRNDDWSVLEFEPQPNEAFVVSIRDARHQSDENNECDIHRVSSPQVRRELISGQAETSQWLKQVIMSPLIDKLY